MIETQTTMITDFMMKLTVSVGKPFRHWEAEICGLEVAKNETGLVGGGCRLQIQPPPTPGRQPPPLKIRLPLPKFRAHRGLRPRIGNKCQRVENYKL